MGLSLNEHMLTPEQEAVVRAKAVVEQKSTELSDDEIAEVADHGRSSGMPREAKT